MTIALDTNIVLRVVNASEPDHKRVSDFVASLRSNGESFALAAQVLHEYWVVATRPIDVNGLGIEPAAARLSADRALQLFSLLPDPPGLFQAWLEMCTRLSIRGRPAYDARLAAWMLLNNVKTLVTLNPGDFRRFPEIHCLTPP